MKPKIESKIIGWIILVLVILGIFVYFFSNSNSKVVVDPNIITIREGTQGFKDNIRIGVANIQKGFGVIYLAPQADNINKDVNTGDNFDFQNYHIQVIEVKENTKILPAGSTGGSNGSVTLKITEK
ncbi:MAG: hypothetical protein UU09_C0042G0002 [Microgenomates group bacterium GW2011_GWA2_40_6]|nr:MAG: hypothetical protein UU09_C0042G0002 [Microgenomates group bacterium GW2011_GWA2_40_6]